MREKEKQEGADLTSPPSLVNYPFNQKMKKNPFATKVLPYKTIPTLLQLPHEIVVKKREKDSGRYGVTTNTKSNHI